MSLRRAGYSLSLLFAAIGCTGSSPVRWETSQAVQGAGAEVTLTPAGGVVPDTLAVLASHLRAPAPACTGSLRLSRSGGRIFSVWWSPRTDSTALLLSSVSNDSGRTWRQPATVDSTDHGTIGCARTAPSITADAASGYVHVSYAMQAAEGPGLFFAHSMDGGITFHTPVPILYGERLGATSVAASGDLVVVAFEDPGSRTPRIGLALSATMGHIFENRVMPVSDDNSAATQPIVAVNGRHITVAWRERPLSSGPVVIRVRTGSLP